MKKSFIIIASLAVVACQGNDLKLDIQDKSQEIPFTFSAYSNNATKADSHNNLDYFYKTFNVYGWKSLDNKSTWSTVFNNVTNEYFTEDANGTVVYPTGGIKVSEEWSSIQTPAFPAWYYQNIRFWDKYATDYQFSAYAPIEASSEVACTSDGKITIGTSAAPVTVETTNLMATPNTTLAYTGFSKDYMTASSNAKVSAVNMVFSHELAKFNVKLVLNSSITTKQDVIVKEVSLKNLNGTSYYDSSNESATDYLTGWHTPTTEITYLANGVASTTDGYKLNGTTPGTDNFSGYYVMERLMIPQTTAKASVNDKLAEFDEACVYVKYMIGDEPFESHFALANLFLGTSTETSYNFLGGNEYTLTINVGPLPIFFTTEVNTWVNHEATIEAN